MKVLISTGGTGGHIYPALLVGKYLRENNIEVIFTIGRRKREIEILKDSGEKFITLPIYAPSSKLFYFNLIFSLFTSFYLLKREKPDRIFAFGSYASFPILFNSKILKIPYFLHEQNTIPGKVIRLFSKGAKKVFISFLNSKDYLKGGNVIFSGMPVREKIGKIDRIEGLKKFGLDLNKLTFLLIGGSSGSKYLLDLIKTYENEIYEMNLQGIIIKGNIEFNYELKFNSVVLEYLNDIEYAYGAVDFVISRGGASTIWEIAYSKKPAILIPIKNSKHQKKNCEFIKNLKVGTVFEEENRENFPKVLKDFIKDLSNLRKNFIEFNLPDTKSIILKEIFNEL